ncbi:prepilin peptidase [Pseudomonas sp. DC3000-4b1]|uniref:prepilin peptidase n=1 Tax=unclassified Pseudomonas TaxID=196821 RepID=UPI003CFB2557
MEVALKGRALRMQCLVLLIWFTLCAEQHVRQRQIADSLTLGGGCFALWYLFTTGHTWLGASASEGAFALALSMLLTLPAYWLGRLTEAEVKLLGTLALATDRMHWLGTLGTALVAGVLWLMLGQRVWAHLDRKIRLRLANLAPDPALAPPLAPFLLMGFLAALTWVR